MLKTLILRQPGKIRSRSFPRKKLAFFFIFLLSSLLKKKQFPTILSSLQQPHGTDLSSLDQMKQEDFILICINDMVTSAKRHKWQSEVIITIVFTISKAYCMDKKTCIPHITRINLINVEKSERVKNVSKHTSCRFGK